MIITTVLSCHHRDSEGTPEVVNILYITIPLRVKYSLIKKKCWGLHLVKYSDKTRTHTITHSLVYLL